MAYKKYIKRGDKIYGPYVYHSRRVDGKVVSEYIGPHKRKINYKKISLVFLAVVLLLSLMYGSYKLFKKNQGIAGMAVLDLVYSGNQTVLVQNERGDDFVSLQLLNSPESVLGKRILEIRIKSYLPHDLNFTLDELKYSYAGGETSLFEEVSVKEKIINRSQESWEDISQIELLGGEEKILKIDVSKIDLSELDLTLPADKKINFEYNGQKISVLLDNVRKGKVSFEIVSTNKTEPLFLPEVIELSESEKEILTKEFGENVSVSVSEAVEKNGLLVMKYELADYEMVRSYDPELSRAIIEAFMERDKIKFIKDIAKTLSQEAEAGEKKDEFLGEWPIK